MSNHTPKEIHQPKNAGLRTLFGRAGFFAIALLVIGTIAIINRDAIAGLVANGWTSRAPGDSLEQGLVGHWTFDGPDTDWSTNTTNDTSGNNNHGTMTNMSTTTSPIAGVLGQALTFNGTTQYLTAADLGNLGDFSVALWVKSPAVPGTSETNALVKYRDNVFMFRWDSTASNPGSFGFIDGVGSYKLVYFYPSIPNHWYHLVGTWNGTTLIVYQDGRLSDSDAPGAVPDLGGTGLEFGRDNSDYFNGSLDDVRIYNRALSADEVKRLYEDGASSFTVNSRIGATPLTEGLVGYWPMDPSDIVATTAPATTTDRSGNGNDGTIYGAATSTGRIGGGGMIFDGAGDYVSAGSPSSLDDIQVLTACAWISPETVGELDGSYHYGSVITKVGAGGWYIGITDEYGSVRPMLFRDFSPNDGTWRPTNATLTLNEWVHLCVVYDSSSVSNDPTIYIDGDPVSLTEEGTPSGTAGSDAALDLRIGTNDTGSQDFDGSIDDVRIYSRALSPKDIADLYALESSSHPDTSLVSHWTFDGPDTNVPAGITLDRGFGGNTGMITGAVPAPGVNGQAMQFDGNDGIEAIANSTIDNMTVKTVAAWIKGSDVLSESTIVAKDGYGVIIDGYSLFAKTSSIYFEQCMGTQSGKWHAGTILPDEWYYVVVTHDNSSTTNDPSIYINGISQAVTEDSAPIGATCDDSVDNLGIGYQTGGFNYLDGSLDDVRIYNRALSATEIADLYQSSAPKLIVNASMNNKLTDGLVGLWSFDGPDVNWATNKALDRSGQGNDGTFINMSTTTSPTPGKIGQAMKFDGVNDTASTSLDLSGTSVIAVAFWLKVDSWVDGDQGMIYGDGSTGFTIIPSDAAGVCTAGDTVVMVTTGAGGPNSACYDRPSSGQWHYWLVVLDTEQPDADEAKLYIDGVFQTQTWNPGDQANTGNFVNDSLFLMSNDGLDSFLNGSLDDIRIYNRALSEAEIDTLYLLGE